MRRRCRYMRMRKRRRVQASGHQPCKMRHIDQQIGPNRIRNLAHAGKIDDARNGRPACNQHLGLMFFCKLCNLIIVDFQIGFAHTVLNGIKPFARLVGLGPMRQVAACIQRHAQNGVAGCQKRCKHPLIGLRAGIGLHICKTAIEQVTGAADGQILGHIDILAPAIIAPPRIAFGVFIGQDRALHLHHSLRDDVL
jgi:hypothetical protein